MFQQGFTTFFPLLATFYENLMKVLYEAKVFTAADVLGRGLPYEKNPKRYQHPVLWTCLGIVFTPKKYQFYKQHITSCQIVFGSIL